MGEILKRHNGYSLRFYEGGRRRVIASKQTSYADARRMLLQIEARIARGEAGLGERPGSRITVAELVARFVRDYSRPKLKDPARYRYAAASTLKRVLPHLGAQPVSSVTAADIARLRGCLSKKFAPGTVKLTQNILGSMFAWAVREGLAAKNPCRGVERPTQPQSLDFLSRDEAGALLDAAAAAATTRLGFLRHVAIALALHCGLRKGELYGLRWRDVDLGTQRLTIARSYRGAPKSGKARHLRLPSELLPLLTRWRAQCPPARDGDAVLPLGRGADGVGSTGAMLGLPLLMRQLGLRKVRHPWHLLRHTFASHFVMAGGNLLALQKILGHADLKVTMLYAHLSPDFLDGEMDKVSFPRRTRD